jgi:hypothetical protein
MDSGTLGSAACGETIGVRTATRSGDEVVNQTINAGADEDI